MNRNKVLIALVFILVIVVAVQTAFIVGRNSVEDTPTLVEQEDTTEVEEVAPVEETPKFVSKFSKYAISHADYQLTDDNFVYCFYDETIDRIKKTYRLNKGYYWTDNKCVQHRVYVQPEIADKQHLVYDICAGIFDLFFVDDALNKFLDLNRKDIQCNYGYAQGLYDRLADYFTKVETKKHKLTVNFVNSTRSTETYMTQVSDMILLETKMSEVLTNWHRCSTTLLSSYDEQFKGGDFINGKIPKEYHARFIRTVNKLATNQLQREVHFEDYYNVNFSKHGLLVEVHDIGDEDSCNYQFVYLPYEEFDKAWFYPEDVKVLKDLGYVPLLW